MVISGEIAGQVLPIVAKPGLPPMADVVQRGNALLQLTPGQHLKAEIVASLPDRVYLARVGGEMLQLEIPVTLRPGETLEMTFVSAEPRLTFQIFHPEGGAASVQLSTLGKWLAGVVKDAPPLPATSVPLLENPAQGIGLLASQLQQALTRGGLFYEAHLAQWVAGTLQLEELLQEPQGRLSCACLGDDILDGARGPAGGEIADPSMLPLVKEQLLLLNSGSLFWKGLAWPGQELEIGIEEKEDDEGEPEIEAKLALILKHLGGVRAKLRFAADGLQVEFVCQRPGTAELLKSGGDELRAALNATGVHLSRMVAKDDQTEP